MYSQSSAAGTSSEPTSKADSPNVSNPPAPPDSTVLELVKKVKPEYPSAALSQKVQGRVIVRAVVSEIGDVETVELVSGDPVLANAAAEAMKQWKFKPFIHDGKPVKAAIKLPFDFAPPEPAGSLVLDAASISNSSGDSVPPSRVKVSSGVIAGMIIHKSDSGVVSHEQPAFKERLYCRRLSARKGRLKICAPFSGHPDVSSGGNRRGETVAL